MTPLLGMHHDGPGRGLLTYLLYLGISRDSGSPIIIRLASSRYVPTLPYLFYLFLQVVSEKELDRLVSEKELDPYIHRLLMYIQLVDE